MQTIVIKNVRNTLLTRSERFFNVMTTGIDLPENYHERIRIYHQTEDQDFQKNESRSITKYI